MQLYHFAAQINLKGCIRDFYRKYYRKQYIRFVTQDCYFTRAVNKLSKYFLKLFYYS